MAKTYQLQRTTPAYLIRYQAKLVVGPYFDVTPSSPDEAFVTEAARHPVFRVTETS